MCSRFINPSLVIYYLRIALPKIKRHFLYDQRWPYIKLFDEQNNSIYGCLQPFKKCIKILEGGGGIYSLPALKSTFYMNKDGHISNCFVHQTIRYMTVFGHIKSAFFKMLGRGQFKGLTEEVIYRTSNIVLWIWNITFNKFLFVHIFHLCLWINWSGVIGAVATIMTWWRTTS